MHSSLSTFSLFPEFAAELRLKIWRQVCSTARVVEARYNADEDRFISTSSPPVVLHVCREARHEALRIYKLYFGTSSAASRIYFHSSLDTLYLPRYRKMGYDETLRDFKSYLAKPEELDSIRRLALDHVDVKVKRPWEGYNKAVWIRSFTRLEQLTLVLCSEAAIGGEDPADDASVGNLEFVEPQENPETIQCILEDFKRSFTQEQTILVSCPWQVAPVVVLPSLRVRAKRIRGLEG